VLVGLGDWITQIFIEDNEEGKTFDWSRLGIMTFLGTCLLGPTLHGWYGFLGSLKAIPSGAAGVATRLCMDQFAFAPVFVGVFMSSVMALEGRVGEIKSELAANWWGAVQVNWMIWIPAQLIMFSVVPLHLQVLWANGVGLIWNCYLSLASHKHDDKKAVEEAKPVSTKNV
jgi:peroxisomal membrane protein 2